MSADLRATLHALAAARARADRLKAEYQAAEAQFRASVQALLDARAAAKAEIAQLDESARVDALAAYIATGQRRPAPGVQVKDYTTYTYDDVAALDWAKAHGLCLALDRKAFETLAAQPRTRPDFVLEVTTPKATLATDLAAALATAEETSDA